MPQNNAIDDPYVEWSDSNDESNPDLYHGGIAVIGGISQVIYDPGQNPVIYPPAPKYVLPPTGNPKVTPPRVKRPHVPPPTYN